MPYPLALYEVDHATPTVTTEWGSDDAGVPAVAHGTVTDTSDTVDDDGWLATLATADDDTITVVWPTPPTPAPEIGEQLIVVGMIRPQPHGRIMLTALTPPVRTGRRAPTHAAARPAAEPAPTPTEPAAPTPWVDDFAGQPTETGPDEAFPLRDEIFDVMRAGHHREPWGVTQHRTESWAVVVCTEDEGDEFREVLFASWRRTLRALGYRIQTRFDLLGTGQDGPTQGPRWLLIEPDRDAQPYDDVPDGPGDHGASGPITGLRADMLLSEAICRYRAFCDLRI